MAQAPDSGTDKGDTIHSALSEIKISEKKPRKKFSDFNFSKRPADHLMIDLGSDTWINAKDTMSANHGISRHFKFYFMYDKPWKSNPYLSTAYGLGLSWSNMYFKDHYVNIKANSSTLPFTDQEGTYHFKSFKLVLVYLEAPIEVRYFSKPDDPDHAWKFAVGGKVGYLTTAYIKGKNWVDMFGNTVYGDGYVLKEYSRHFFQPFKASVSVRGGYGLFSLHAEYQLTPILKSGYGPNMETLSLGVTISGL